MSGEKRVGKRAESKRRWDRENLRGLCRQCGGDMWTHTNKSGLCKRCETGYRYRVDGIFAKESE